MTAQGELLPPRLRAALDAGAEVDAVAAAVIEDPLGAIELGVRSPDESGWADGLFGADGYVLAASDAEGALMSGHVDAVPLQIARLVGLGPRPLAGGAEEIAVGDFSGVDDALAAGELPEAVAAALSATDVLRWSVRASWISPDGPAEREVVAIDGGSGGLLLCAPVFDGDDVALLPCTATDVWRALCALLPYPAETV